MANHPPHVRVSPLPRLTRQVAQSVLRPRMWPSPLCPDTTQLYFRGSNAIWHAVKALKLEPGSGVLFPAYHCGIELDVLLAAGLTVTFYGVGRELKINVRALAAQLRPGTWAVYVIHYFGIPQDLTDLAEFCHEHRLALIEDCAMALYSRRGERPTGSDGDVAIFSMWKTVAMPFGGALVVNNPNLEVPKSVMPPSRYEVLRVSKQLLEMEFKGSRLFEGVRRWCVEPFAKVVRGVSAVTSADTWRKQALWVPLFAPQQRDWGITRLSRHLFLTADQEQIRTARRDNYQALLNVVRDCASCVPLCGDLPDGACPLYFPVIVSNAVTFRAFLLSKGVEAFRFWRELHPSFPRDEFPDETYLRAHVVALPVHQHLSESGRLRICEALESWDRSGQVGEPQQALSEPATQYVEG